MRFKQLLSLLICATSVSVLGTVAQDSTMPASPETAPAPAAGSTAAPATVPAAPAAAAADPTHLIPGALEHERGALLQKILRAKAQGCGVSSYMAEFSRIQDSVASGQPTASVQPRISSLSKALDEQLERSQTLKVQRIPPPQSTSASMASPGGGPGMPMGGGGGSNLDQLMKQYGNKIPKDFNKEALMKEIGNDSGNKNSSASDLFNRFKDDPRAKDLLNKLKAN